MGTRDGPIMIDRGVNHPALDLVTRVHSDDMERILDKVEELEGSLKNDINTLNGVVDTFVKSTPAEIDRKYVNYTGRIGTNKTIFNQMKKYSNNTIAALQDINKLIDTYLELSENLKLNLESKKNGMPSLQQIATNVVRKKRLEPITVEQEFALSVQKGGRKSKSRKQVRRKSRKSRR